MMMHSSGRVGSLGTERILPMQLRLSRGRPNERGGNDAILAIAVFAIAYLALAFGDTLLLAPSRAVAAETQEPPVLEWAGAAAHLAAFNASD